MTTKGAASVWDPVLERLWKHSRFASFFYQSVGFVPNEDLPTLALTVFRRRLTLFYNPEFASETEPGHLIGLLVHEMFHVILNHEHRLIPGRDAHLQNLAQDMVINTFLWESRKTFFSRRGRYQTPELELPAGLPMVPKSFFKETGTAGNADITWEEVYAWLNARSAFPDTSKREQEPGLPGDDEPAWQSLDKRDDQPDSVEGLALVDQGGEAVPTGVHLFGDSQASDQADAGAKRVLRFIQHGGECAGERAFQDVAGMISAPKKVKNLDWIRNIRTIMDYSRPRDQWEYSNAKFNRRYFASGIYAPGRRFTYKPLITVVVDVSGSMAAHPEEMEQAFGVIEELVTEYRINLLCIDQDLFVPERHGDVFRKSQSNRPYYYKKGDWKHIRSGNRGTTLFAPLFNSYLKGHREALIVMTDGYIYDLKALKPYSPTLWAVSAKQVGQFHPPFGRVVCMDEDL